MDRREFFQTIAMTTAMAQAAIAEQAETPDIAGRTLQCEFPYNNTTWKVYEDLGRRDGSLTFVPARGTARVMTRRPEAVFSQAATPFLGLSQQDIGSSLPDLLADKLLAGGSDPDEIQVRDAAPLIGGPIPPNPNGPGGGNAAGGGGTSSWNTFVGTKECFDTAPVYAAGNTRTYHPDQYFPEMQAGGAGDKANTRERWEGLLGGWMPAVHKIFPINDQSYIDMLIFGDVEAHDKFIVQTWHRTARIDNGKMTKVVFGYSYPAYPPFKQDPNQGGVLSRAAGVRRLLGQAVGRFRAHQPARPDPGWICRSTPWPRKSWCGPAECTPSTAPSTATITARSTTAFRTFSPRRSTPTWNWDASSRARPSSTTTSPNTPTRAA